MKTGINIGMPSTISALDAAIQASLVSPEVPPADVTITIQADTDMRGGRLHSDGNYYTITFPDDYLGGSDLFASSRSDVTTKIGTGVDASANLDIIFNIPVDMRIGANTVIGSKPYLTSNPCIHFRLDTDEWDSGILSHLNITVNNYGIVVGAGGVGGYGGMHTSGKVTVYNVSDGGGSGFGLHPAWGTTEPDDYYDPLDVDAGSPYPYPIAGQAGAGYGRWLSGLSAYGGSGTHGTLEEPGDPGTSAHGDAAHSPPALAVRPGEGGIGGTVLYITSNVHGIVTGTHFNIYNEGWMSAGTGGGGGTQSTTSPGEGGSWTTRWTDWVYGNDYALGQGGDGRGGLGGGGSIYVLGGMPGNFINAVSSNLTTTNSINNQSANTIYGGDGIWPGI